MNIKLHIKSSRLAITVIFRFSILIGSLTSTGDVLAKEPAAHPGRIRGVVLSAVDRQPVAAYVGVGDFWDSGGSNHSRHRENGLYVKTKTDAQGRFELDGHRFITPGGDPHLSAFANSVWMQGPMTRRGQMYSPEFTFTQLKSGPYRLDVIRFQMKTIIPNRSDRYAMPWDPTGFAYHGGIDKITALPGQTTQVQIQPQNHGTTLHLKMPEIKNKENFPQVKKIPTLVSLSRNPGLMVWDSDLVYSLEDSRLGRIQEQALFFTMAGGADSITIRNLPPGEYTIFAGPAMLMNVIPDPALADRKIEVKPGSYEIWDLLEELHTDKNWQITETDNQTLLIQE